MPRSTRHPFCTALVPAGIWVACVLASGVGLPARAEAQQCPSEYTACDNGGCCLSSEQCCPTAAEGCCSSSAPYCCGDGTCAATPSQCASAGGAACDGYDVPCGGGCAPAGSDCCDLAGHYCPPESMCTSETTCAFGNMPTLAREVALTPQLEQARGARLSPPFRDPADASERSCSLNQSPAGARHGREWLGLAAALMFWRRASRIRMLLG